MELERIDFGGVNTRRAVSAERVWSTGYQVGRRKGRGRALRSPFLHLIVVEDDIRWGDRIAGFVQHEIERWRLHKTRQFQFKLHRIRSFSGFQELSRRLIDEGEIVYATLDLHILGRDDDQTPVDLSHPLIHWCFELAKVSFRDQFGFCLISGSDDLLDQLFQDPELGERLILWGVNHVYKKDIVDGLEGDRTLSKISQDIKAFLARNISFCRFPVRLAHGEVENQIIWFGEDPRLHKLLSLADRIASDSGGGLFLLFADSVGYEEAWFRLCCHLRGVAPRIRDFGKTDPLDPSWVSEIRDPPEALLICGVDQARRNRCNLRAVFEQEDFFAKVKARKSLVFIQFPNGETELSITKKLQGFELDLLWDCLAVVYRKKGKPTSGIGFAFREHRRLVPFPDHSELRHARVSQHTLGVLEQECQQIIERNEARLDPEVAGVLAEMPWESLGGLSELQFSVTEAYRHFDDQGDLIRLEHFTSASIREYYEGSRGFVIRGRMLYQILEENGTFSVASPASRSRETMRSQVIQPIEGLEIIFDLFTRLQGMMQLQEKLERAQGNTPFDQEFSLEHFETLRAAYRFLESLFKSPRNLHRKIEEFRPFAETPRWQTFFPSLREREDWFSVVENIRFSWPFAQLPLHFAVYDYLERSGVIAEIHTEVHRVLSGYEDLKQDWMVIEERRKEVLKQLQDREEQRRRAMRFVRQHSFQPLSVYLEESDDRGLDFIFPCQALLFFQAAVAACENHYVFEGRFIRQRSLLTMLGRPDLGPCTGLLAEYLKALEEDAKAQRRSVFRRWVPSWPTIGRQPDVARRIADLAQRILDSHFQHLRPGELEIVRTLAEIQGECPPPALLEFFRVLRNRFAKRELPGFWQSYRKEVLMVMRSFVAATTPDRLQFGSLRDGGRSMGVWTPYGLELTALERSQTSPREGSTWMLAGPSSHPLFPLAPLIQIQPENGSVWAYYAGGSWINLTFVAETGQLHELVSGAEHPWLPLSEDVRKSSIWRWAHGK